MEYSRCAGETACERTTLCCCRRTGAVLDPTGAHPGCTRARAHAHTQRHVTHARRSHEHACIRAHAHTRTHTHTHAHTRTDKRGRTRTQRTQTRTLSIPSALFCVSVHALARVQPLHSLAIACSGLLAELLAGPSPPRRAQSTAAPQGCQPAQDIVQHGMPPFSHALPDRQPPTDEAPIAPIALLAARRRGSPNRLGWATCA